MDTAASALGARLGPLGIWSDLNGLAVADALAFVREVEALGAGAIWIHEGLGREPFAVLGALARETTRISLGVGIASIYARDAVAAHAGARTIADLSAGRFVMGLGVSHRSSVAARGHAYDPPLRAMRRYLDAYEAAGSSVPGGADAPLVLAALGPRMLALAAERTSGAFPFLVPVQAVAEARRTLDAAGAAAGRAERPLLVVSMHAILGSGEGVLDAARATVSRYLVQPSYRDNLLRAGIESRAIETVDDGLVHALVATGDADALRERAAALHAAGADHVVAIPLSRAGRHGDLATAGAVLGR